MRASRKALILAAAVAAVAAVPLLQERESVTAVAAAGPTVEFGSQAPADEVRYVVAASGNAARYRIREQLAGFDLPNDAVGETRVVSGAIVVGADGRIVGASRIVVGVGSLASDSDRRDGFVRRRTLETEQHPTVEFRPTETRGIRLPPTASGSRHFQLLGDLTVRGVTRPTVWSVQAAFAGDTVSGTAETRFTFADFTITQPRVPIVLSVADTIRLEYDFRLIRQR